MVDGEREREEDREALPLFGAIIAPPLSSHEIFAKLVRVKLFCQFCVIVDADTSPHPVLQFIH